MNVQRLPGAVETDMHDFIGLTTEFALREHRMKANAVQAKTAMYTWFVTSLYLRAGVSQASVLFDYAGSPLSAALPSFCVRVKQSRDHAAAPPPRSRPSVINFHFHAPGRSWFYLR